MSAADRQQRRRRRERDGLVLLRLEAEHYPLAEAAIVSGLLTEEEALDRSNLEKAIGAVVREWARRFAGK